MLVVIPCTASDLPRLRRLFRWITALDGDLKKHECLIVCEPTAPFREAMEARDDARQLFGVSWFTTKVQAALEIVPELPKNLIEITADWCPLKKGWLDKISENGVSGLIHRYNGNHNLSPTFVMERRHGSAHNVLTRGDIPGEAVVFVGNLDGTLFQCIAQIDKIPFELPPEETTAD